MEDLFDFVKLICSAIISKSSSFNLSLFLKLSLSILGYSLTIIKYLFSNSFTCTSEKRSESFKTLIILFVDSLFEVSGISFKIERITSVSVNSLPWISNVISLEINDFDKKEKTNMRINLYFKIV